MEGLGLDQNNHCVLWKTETAQAERNALGWHMLENNEIEGLLPFDYFYVDHQICFRYLYHSLQRLDTFFQKKEGDFEIIFFLCREVLMILERGQEFLLDYGGYLLSPDWIFWNRCERKLFLCYLPGKEGDFGKEYKAFVQYLMKRTDHSDKRAVSLIYGLYDLLISDGFVPENLLLYLQKVRDGGEDDLPVKGKERQKHLKRVDSLESNSAEIKVGYWLRPLQDKDRMGRLQGLFLAGQVEKGYPVRQGELTVGRNQESDLYLPFCEISRRHALILCETDSFYLMDSDSTNGTYLNGSRISAFVRMPCKEGDIITFADISYQLAAGRPMRKNLF